MSNSKDVFKPGFRTLTEDETNSAAQDLIIKHPYPKVIRDHIDPPIVGQKHTNVSFIFLNEPGKTANGKPIFGFVKVRGVWPDELPAFDDAKRLIREVDSQNIIHQFPVGYWAPITNDESYSKKVEDVSNNEQEDELRRKAIREAESEQKRIQRELQEREKELQEREFDRDPDSLDYYTLKKVSYQNIAKYISDGEKKLDGLRKALLKNEEEINRLNTSFPQYSEMWISNYNKERERAGLDPIKEESDITKTI
jgi:hypothetical protein